MKASFLSILDVQKRISAQGFDGWLLYDFRKTNDLACRFLGIGDDVFVTRRFFYWIPRSGDPVKIVHRIEPRVLQHLPGKELKYSSWQELEKCLADTLSGSKKVCMEYSPRNAVPTVSKVDAGTAETVSSCGIKIGSSADILQHYISVWTSEQFASHRQAAAVLQDGVEQAWKLIATSLKNKTPIDEWQVQQFLLSVFEKGGCCTDVPPICAVNAHSADPHYSPEKDTAATIQEGDFILIDVWCKLKEAGSVYADITRVAVAAEKATPKQQQIFDVVRAGRDAAMAFLEKRLSAGEDVQGWEVDRICRDAIGKVGYGAFFTHRTGHSIGEKDHGDGANIDDFETREERQLLPGTCFSIEPGVYLPGEFGIRLEDDVYIDPDGSRMHVTGGLQQEIACLSKIV